MSSKSKQQQQQKEFEAFKLWVRSLSREDLLDAMAFTFHGHEYDILVDMVQLQSPPPTPVHPIAVGYKSRSQKGARLDYWYREEECLRWRQPRLFHFERLVAQVIARKKQLHHKKYQVIARKKIGPWGDYFGLGCTFLQQNADAKIVLGTRLGRQKLPQSDGRVTEERTAWFVPEDSSSNDSCPGAILKLLRIVTRGNFLQGPLHLGKHAYYAPWLKPDERWFSLSMYLGSRYELALHESYQQHTNHGVLLGSAIRNTVPRSVSPAVLRTNLLSSICLALQETFRNEKERPAIDYIRDGIIWALLEQNLTHCSIGSPPFSPKLGINALETPLVHAHLPVYTHFQVLVRTKLEELLAKDAERSVLIENGASVSGVLSNNVTVTTKKRRKRSKKKKRNGNVKASYGTSTLPVIPADSEEDMEDEDDQEEEIQSVVSVALEFPQNDTLPQDRSRNINSEASLVEDDQWETVGARPVSKVSRETIQIKWKKKTPPNAVKSADAPNNTTNDATLNESNGPAIAKPVISFESTSQPAGVIARPMSFDLEATEQYQNPVPHAPWGVPFSIPDQRLSNQRQERNTSYHPTDAASIFSGPSSLHDSDFHDPFAIGRSLMLGMEGAVGSESDGNWAFINRYQSRDESILSEFFPNRSEDDEDELLMTASTAASIASSTYKDTTLIVEAEGLEDDEVVSQESAPSIRKNLIQEADEEYAEAIEHTTEQPRVESSTVSENESVSLEAESYHADTVESPAQSTPPVSAVETTSNGSTPECRSPSPEAPLTPPPTLSPILLSLADLKDLREVPGSNSSLDQENLADKKVTAKLPSIPGHGSLPSSPIAPPKDGLTSSWSRDDLRIQAFRDDQSIKQTSNRPPPTPQPPRAAETPTYKAMAVKSLAKPIASTKVSNVDFRTHVMEGSLKRQDATRESCARSETALDGQHEDLQQSWAQEDTENYSLTRDETTTITSGVSQRVELEELATVRDERNQFRDMCLTLGAEVAKLKAMLAAQQTAIPSTMEFHDAYSQSMMHRPGSFDPNGMQPFFSVGHGMRPGPMSDAGFQRGDHESQVSEDEVYEAVSKAREARVGAVRRMSSSHTVAGSDASIDFNNSNPTLSGNQLSGTMPLYDSNGLQSRLTKDIFQFLSSTTLQLKKLDGKRKLAVARFSRLVKTIWPRAQVKLYGSYMSGLCLPNSDLDFVVCLPAVHKKDVAKSPGVLEGRNAINETSQKLLARELKGESWVDPRSIKLIERTIVPVIKVSTKDTRARVIQLDISFDSPEHHGLEANQMVAAILDELPLIRPLMLVLKNFLLDRGLLTAYTGGLSSYCLFLMVARYLQEQPPSSGDSGSLLMGFLDFYGNCFDARATGISVSRRQYFARSNNFVFNGYQDATPPPMWNNSSHSHQHQQRVVVNMPTASMRKDFRRHNSFSETGSMDGNKLRHHRFPPTPSSGASTGPSGAHLYGLPTAASRQTQHVDLSSTVGQVRPFTFDPLFVEDPLSPSNNVGRNAFRINQVQRAFSDAHRALTASLDWDFHSSPEGGGDYPLLKSMLQREDVVYDF
ncbi:MAG: hypothetical protein SGILL_000962 [Bacillariaceae sp.]